MKNSRIITAGLVACLLAGVSASGEDDAAFKRDRYLVLDSRIIESKENAELKVGTVKKHPANPLFTEDKSWENNGSNLYPSVLYDPQDKLYKLWYNLFIVNPSAKGMTWEERQSKPFRHSRNRTDGTSYAYSRDGIHWKKPELGLVEYNGSKKNNIVFRDRHGAGVFKDPNASDPQKRYKTLFQDSKERMCFAYSSDGIHWSKDFTCQGVDVPGETHNNAFWDPALGKYVGITRKHCFEKYGRRAARIESDDFLHWTKAEVILRGDGKTRQVYSMPVFRYADVYIGLPTIINTKTDRTHVELAWSPDSRRWHRIAPGTPLIPNSNKRMAYDWGCVFAADDPVISKEEIRLYYAGADGYHSSWRVDSFCLATLRPDGFAGYEQEDKEKPALVTTKAVPYDREKIRVTADVEKGGSMKVTVMDANGEELKVFTVQERVTDKTLKSWKRTKSDKIKLKFELHKAKVYSFSFSD